MKHILFLLLVAPLSFGSDYQYLVDNGATDLIPCLMVSDPYRPQHETVWDWNTNAVIPPEDIDIGHSIFIDAWVKVLSVMPSVMTDRLYVPFQANIMSGYGHNITLPYYDSPGHPLTRDHDCRTEYSLVSESSELKIQDQVAYKLYLMDFGTDTLIEASYHVSIDVEVDHYKWETECCKKKDDRCLEYCHYCRLHSTEVITDELTVEDQLQVYLYNEPGEPVIEKTDQYLNTIRVAYNNSANLFVEAGNASFEEYNYLYSLVFIEPELLQVTAEQIHERVLDNVFIDDNDLIFRNEKCNYTYYTHFSTNYNSCNLENLSINLSIKTDNLVYHENDSIKVEIFPDDVEVFLSYADENKTAKGIAEFDAKQGSNTITAKYRGRETKQVVHIENQTLWKTLLDLSAFSAVCYCLYIALQKTWGVALG